MAVVYQKDKNAIKFVRDFYKQFKPNYKLTQVDIDSIFAQYDGDYASMVTEMYKGLTNYNPSEKDISSVINEYALKKKDSENGLSELATGESEQLETEGSKEIFTAEEGAIVDPNNLNIPEEDVWNYDYITKSFTKNSYTVNDSEVPENIRLRLLQEAKDSIDLQNQDVPRTDPTVVDFLNKNKYVTDFSTFFNQEGAENFFKSIDLYQSNPDNFQYLLQPNEDGNSIEYNGIQVPITSSISENGRKLLGASNNDNNTFLYEIPVSQPNTRFDSLEAEDSTLAQGFRTGDEGQIFQSVDEQGLNDYELLVNLDSHIENLELQRRDLTGKKYVTKDGLFEDGVQSKDDTRNLVSIDFNDLNEEQQNQYTLLTEQLNAAKVSKTKLNKQIGGNSIDYGVIDVESAYGGLKTDEQKNNFLYSTNSQISQKINKSENYSMNNIINQIKSDIKQELAVQYSNDTKLKKFISTYELQSNKKFTNVEEMVGDPVFANMWERQSREDRSKLNKIISLMSGDNGEAYTNQTNLNLQIKRRQNELRDLQIKRNNNNITETEFIDKSSEMQTTLSTLINKRNKNRENRGFEEGTKMYNENGERIEGVSGGEDSIMSGIVAVEENLLMKAFKDSKNQGKFITQLYKAQDGLYSNELMYQESWSNDQLTLPSGKKMTMKEMYEFMHKITGDDLNILEGVVDFFAVGANPLSYAKDLRERADARLEEDYGVISLNQQLRSIEKSIPNFFAKNIGAKLAGSNKEDADFIIEVLKNFKSEYYQNQGQLVATSNIIEYNVDPGKEWAEKSGTGLFLRQALDSFGHAVNKRITHSEDDMINYYDDIANAYGIELTDDQKAGGEINLNDMVAQGVGTTLPIMLEMMITMPIAGAGITKLLKIPKMVQLSTVAKSTPTGKFWFSLGEDMMKSSIAFEMTSGDQATWRMGAAEAGAETVFTKIFTKTPASKLLLNMYKSYGKSGVKLATLPPRIIGGGGIELIAEYSGELVENLNRFGFDWNEALSETVGRSKDEALNKLVTTAIICVGMSTAFTMMTANTLETQFKAMLEEGGLSPEDENMIRNTLEALDTQKNSKVGQQLKLWEDGDLDNAMDETPDGLRFLNEDPPDGPEGPSSPIGSFGEGPGGLPSTKKDEEDLMPVSGGRQLNIFEDESVRSSAGNTTSNNAGNRLFNDPNPETSNITKNYINNNSSNLGIENSDSSPVTEINEENSKNIADAYDAMENNPNDPKVKKAYTALANETIMQYQDFINAGYTIEIYKGKGEPYANSDEMIKDVRDNKHLYIFGTESGFGQEQISDQMREENPLLQQTEFKDINGNPLLVNDLFRGVHDFFGHTELGNGFGIKGEENAWLNHSRMFSHEARRAMTTETRGQNSWVNFNQSLRREDGSIPKKGDPDYVRPQDRPFADQKIGLLSDEFVFQQQSKDLTENVTKDTDNVPFKYNRTEKVYKGKVNGREFSLVKKLGKQEWIDPSSGTILGRTKKEAISNLKLAMEGPTSIDLLESSDQMTENLASVIDLINTATNPNETNVINDTKSPIDNKSLVDRAIRGIDEELSRISRNKGKTLNMDLTLGLGPVAWELFLKTLKTGLKAGQTISVAFNKAIESIKSSEEIKDISIDSLKNKFLFSNDGVVKFAEEAIINKVTAPKFFESLKEKYPNQFNELEAKEIYKIAKLRVNPKVVRSNYTKNELKGIDNLQSKIDQHNVDMKNDPSLSDPIQILFDGGFVVMKNGRPITKTLSFNLNGAPIFEGLTEQQKIELSSELLIQDFNANSSKIDLKKATGWYSNTKVKIQEKFGSNAEIFFELLGVTSPQSPPRINFRKSTEVLYSYNQGKFDDALNLYDVSVKDIMSKYDTGDFGVGLKALNKAKELIGKASHDPKVLESIKKKNGKGFGLPAVNAGIVRVLYGNWLSNNPANKTGQFYNNLSLRDRSATIDVWAARNMRRVLYSQGGIVPFRRKASQESTVNSKDFAFAQSVYAVAAKKLNLNPDDLQAAMWFIEKQIYADSGWTENVAAKDQATMLNALKSMQMTDRIMIGASSYIGNTKPEHKDRIFKTVSREIQKALDRNANMDEVASIMAETMKGAVRMDQALLNIQKVVKDLGAIGRPYQSEGLYNNEVEDTINLEILVDSNSDLTSLFDEVISTGINNEQESVFVSKVTTEQDPNARPFRRIEFDEALTLTDAKVMANEIFGPNNISGLTLNLNQQAEVIGMSFQFVPEYSMKPNGEGLTIENIKEYESKWIEGADKSINQIAEKYGEDIFNTVENGYINTKVFTNGEYETIKGQEKSFETDINTELARRQRIVNSGDNAQDISDLRTGDEFDSRSVQRFQILNDFADKLDQVYKDLGKNVYSDPFLAVPIIRAALKTASIVLRATSSVAKAVDAAVDYLKQAQGGENFIPDQEQNIRDFFKDFTASQGGLKATKDIGSSGETEISEEEMSEMEEHEETHEKTKEEFQKELNEGQNRDLDVDSMTQEELDKLDKSFDDKSDAAMSGGKDNFFTRLLQWKFYDDKFVQLKELTVDTKYRIKRSIRNLSKNTNLNESSSNALAAITLWMTVPGTAKNLIDKANKRIWGTLSSAQIKLVGKLSMLERIIELDSLSDAKKVAADALIKELNSGKLSLEQEKEIKDQLEKLFESNPNINLARGKKRGRIKKGDKRWNKPGTDYVLEYTSKNKDGKNETEVLPPGLNKFGEGGVFPWRLKHPSADGKIYNKELCERLIEGYKTKWGRHWNVVRDATDKLFQEYSNQLKLNYENGLISEEIYNELKNTKYNPRKFVDHVIFSERNINQLRRSGQDVKADHLQSVLKTLKQGSDQVLFMDPVKLLQNTIAVGAKLRFENDVRKSIYELISEATENGIEYINGRAANVAEEIGYILQDGESVMSGYIEMSYSQNGKKIRFAMPIASYTSLFSNPRDGMTSSDFANKITYPFRFAGSTLKVFATGVGAPFFFVANVFYDFAQQVMMTETYNGELYSATIFTKFLTASGDWVSVMKDVAMGGPLTKEYLEMGGSLEFMTRYGLMDYTDELAIDEIQLSKRTKEIMSDPENKLTEEQAREKASREQMNRLYGPDAPFINPNTKSGFDLLKKITSGLNGISELTGRVANTKRWTIKYINEYKKKNDGQEPTGQDLIDIKKRAIAQAVDYANFNSGGKAIKFLDSLGFAYLNAGSVVLDKSVRYASKNPIQFAWDVAQWSLTFGAGVMAYNLSRFDVLDDEKEEELQIALDNAINNKDAKNEKSIRQQLHDNKRYWVDYIPDYDMENYHCILLPGVVTDIINPSTEKALKEQLKIAQAMDIGKERTEEIANIKSKIRKNRIIRPRYIKIPSDARLNPGRVLLEDLTYKHITGEEYRFQAKEFMSYTPWGRGDEKNAYGRILQKAIPAGGGNPYDIAASNPLLNVALKATMNYDAFYNKPIWPDKYAGAKGYTQFTGRKDSYQDAILKDLSKKMAGDSGTGFPVTTTKSTLSSLFTNLDRNPVYAMLNHSYIAATGGLDEYEKEEYGNQMNIFLDDLLSPVTKRYIGELNLEKTYKSPLQEQAKFIRREESNFNANLSIARDISLKKNRVNKDPLTGQWVNSEGQVLRFYPEEYYKSTDMDRKFFGLDEEIEPGMVDARAVFRQLSQNIIDDTKKELISRLGDDRMITDKYWNEEEIMKRINRMVEMDWKHGGKSADVRAVIRDFRQGNKLTAAYMLYNLEKTDIDSYIKIREQFRELNINTDPEVKRMMIIFENADEENLRNDLNTLNLK